MCEKRLYLDFEAERGYTLERSSFKLRRKHCLFPFFGKSPFPKKEKDNHVFGGSLKLELSEVNLIVGLTNWPWQLLTVRWRRPHLAAGMLANVIDTVTVVWNYYLKIWSFRRHPLSASGASSILFKFQTVSILTTSFYYNFQTRKSRWLVHRCFVKLLERLNTGPVIRKMSFLLI
jgi:hypothetical protein